MKYRVLISEEALDGMRQFLRYLAVEQASPLTAQRWWDHALAKVFSLSEMPHRCPYAPENEFEELTIRMLIVDRSLFLFTVEETAQVVRILKFRHSSQKPRPLDVPEDA